MNLYWSNWSDFWAMGGYGAHVWGSFGVALLAVALELWSLRQRRKALQADSGEAP